MRLNELCRRTGGGRNHRAPRCRKPHSHQILSGIQSVWVRNMNIPDRQIRNGNGWSCDGNISATNRSWELRLAERNIRYLRYWTLHPIPPRSANNLVKHWSFYNQQPLPPRFASWMLTCGVLGKLESEIK